MNTEMSASGFHDRLAQIIGTEEPLAWAKRAGIPSATFSRIWKEGTVPKWEHLCRIAEFSGATLDWLVRGKEAVAASTRPPSTAEDHASPPAAIDEQLMARVAEGIAEVYRSENAKISSLPLVKAAARMYAEVVAACDTPEDLGGALKLALAQLRRDLRTVPREGAPRKETA